MITNWQKAIELLNKMQGYSLKDSYIQKELPELPQPSWQTYKLLLKKGGYLAYERRSPTFTVVKAIPVDLKSTDISRTAPSQKETNNAFIKTKELIDTKREELERLKALNENAAIHRLENALLRLEFKVDCIIDFQRRSTQSPNPIHLTPEMTISNVANANPIATAYTPSGPISISVTGNGQDPNSWKNPLADYRPDTKLGYYNTEEPTI